VSVRRLVLVGLAMLLVLVALSVLTQENARLDGALDPRNPGRDGAEALARVLDDHGVDVHVVRGEQALLGTDVDAGTTVVVTNPGELGRSTLRRMQRHASDAAAQVLVGSAGLLGELFDLRTASGSVSGRARASCEVGLARGLVLHAHGAGQLRARGCFGSGDGSLLVRRDRLWLLTAPASLSNGRVLESGNAALALRLFGQGDRVVWYVADGADLAGSDGVGLAQLLPRWLFPALILLGAGVLALLLWRGRRLGPLVTEPLPVVVRAVESTRSRGRLYRSTQDRQHTATVLADASRRRLTASLRLPRDTSVDQLAAAVAARTARDPSAVRALLAQGPVTTDTQLADLGRQLIELENEVHHR
jgi:hypothetical protein